jgi:hypothetical protein
MMKLNLQGKEISILQVGNQVFVSLSDIVKGCKCHRSPKKQEAE